MIKKRKNLIYGTTLITIAIGLLFYSFFFYTDNKIDNYFHKQMQTDFALSR